MHELELPSLKMRGVEDASRTRERCGSAHFSKPFLRPAYVTSGEFGKAVHALRIVDQNALACAFIGRPVGEQIEQDSIVGFAALDGGMRPIAAPEHALG